MKHGKKSQRMQHGSELKAKRKSCRYLKKSVAMLVCVQFLEKKANTRKRNTGTQFTFGVHCVSSTRCGCDAASLPQATFLCICVRMLGGGGA
jgi:hypothetical protein